MRTTKVIETHLEDLKGWNWLGWHSEDGKSFYFIEDNDMEREAAEKWGVPVKFVKEVRDALKLLAESIIEELTKDLEDIWKKITEEQP